MAKKTGSQYLNEDFMGLSHTFVFENAPIISKAHRDANDSAASGFGAIRSFAPESKKREAMMASPSRWTAG
jgi:hypothetical protein